MDTHEELFMSFPAGHKHITKTLLHMAKHEGYRKKRGTKGNINSTVVVVGGSQGTLVNKVCWELNTSLQFTEFCQIPAHPYQFGVCKFPGGFILTGGGNDCVLCSMFVLSTKSWKQLNPLKFLRSSHGSIVAHGTIFLFGGYKSSVKSAFVHSLALDGGKWTEETDLPIAMIFPEVSNVENSIFLLDVDTNQLLKMNAKKKSWSPKKKLPGERCYGARMVSTRDKLFVSGGNNKTCAQYDPKTDTWCSLNSPTLEHLFGAMVALEQKVYLTGGGVDCIEEYNFDSKTWVVCSGKVPTKFYHLHTLVLDK